MKEYWIIAVSSEADGVIIVISLTIAHSTVAVALWVMTPGVPVSSDLQLTMDNVYEGGIDGVITDNPGWLRKGRD